MKTFFTVHAIAINDKNQILVLQRANHRTSPGKWNCVTGFVQERESAEEAALRELKEETGLEGKIIGTTEPFWRNDGEIKWVVVSSLIKVIDVSNLKIDETESQAHKWIAIDDEIIKNSESLQRGLKKLGVKK